MTSEAFIDELNRLLAPYGGSYARPAGWMPEGLAFNCMSPPITIPHPEDLTAVQRQLVITRLGVILKK